MEDMTVVNEVIGIVEGFFQHLVNKEYGKMLNHVQITWKRKYGDKRATDFIVNAPCLMTVKSWKVIGAIVISKVCCRVKVRVSATKVSWLKYRDKEIMVLKEVGPYMPSEKGSWGLNPVPFNWAGKKTV